MVRLPTHSDTPQPKKKCGCQLGVTILIAFILVSWFLGPCAVFGVLSQPKAAFRSAGHSKLRWLAVEIVGTLLSYTGIITWLLYSIWIRPSVVRAGGRRRKKGAFFSVFFQALATPAAQSASPARSSSASSSARPSRASNWAAPATNNTIGSTQPAKCGSCSGSGNRPALLARDAEGSRFPLTLLMPGQAMVGARHAPGPAKRDVTRAAGPVSAPSSHGRRSA